jgi:uncharacterized protein with HEPN domain
MQPESRKLLLDMRYAADEIAGFTRNKLLEDYLHDKQLRWAVERGFEIVGEALAQLSKLDPALAAGFSEQRKIISFRNVLIHGYSQISHARTWAIIQQDLPTLRRELDQILQAQE